MALVPFWLKTPSIFASAGGRGWHMSAPTLGSSEWELTGDTVLLGVFLVGTLTGGLFGGLCVCCRFASRGTSAPTRAGEKWIRVVLRAIRFVQRRRRISLAFGNYKNHRLRPAGQRAKAKARPATPRGPVLQEGPAISHGSVRNRLGGHEHPRGGL